MLKRKLYFSLFNKVKYIVKSELKEQQIESTVGNMLAQELRKNKVDLPFECSYKCQCATCAIKLNEKDFQKLQQEQPVDQPEQQVLQIEDMNNRQFYDKQLRIRLSCQN
ncbi:hypothetical protein pb186bvf_011361 [Paramecium bursaria]